MRSSLFGENLETTSDEGMSLQNPRMLKVRLDGEVLARPGRDGRLPGRRDLRVRGRRRRRALLKKALTGEGVPLMRCQGRGDVFLARTATSCTCSTSTATR
jgi:uncharacterized protein (AIM24 family)